MNWLLTHKFLLAWLVPTAVLISVPFKKLPEGKSRNWAQLIIGIGSLIGLAMQFKPGMTGRTQDLLALLALIGIGITISMPSYNEEAPAVDKRVRK